MDQFVSFTFENYSVRGALVRLSDSWKKVLDTSLREEGDKRVRGVLAEFIGAGLLLSGTVKLEGSLLIQLMSEGPLSMLLVEVFVKGQQQDLSFRALAKTDPELLSGVSGDDISSLSSVCSVSSDKNSEGSLSEGETRACRLALTIDPKEGSQAYQSIVPVTSNSISQIFESYMMQSEQIDTRLFLFADENSISGVLLQVIPNESASSLSAETAVITREFLDKISSDVSLCDQTILHLLSSNDVLRSLFPEHDVRVYDDRRVSFECTCSRDKIASVIITLGKEEAEKIVQEEGAIKVSCEFCGQDYAFDSIDTTSLFTSTVVADSGKWKN